jgi:O-antigen/teichoic acid export membrane protein
VGRTAELTEDLQPDLPVEPAPASPVEDSGDPARGSALFGRSLLYVVVASLQFVSGAIASPILAHLLDDPAEFGALSSAIALHQLLIVFALAGLDQAVVLKRAEDGHDHAVRALASASILLATAVTALLWVTARWWAVPLGFEQASPLVTITVLWTIPSAGVVVVLGLLLASDRLKPYSWVTLLAIVGGQALGIVFVLTLDRSASVYAGGLLAADAVAMVVGFAVTRPTLRGALDWSLLKPALALGTPLMLGALSSFVLNAGDRIIIQRIAGAAEVGRYQIAYTVGFVALQLLGQTSKSWIPRFAAVADQATRWRLIGQSRDSLYRVLSPVVLGMMLGAPVVLGIVAPASFRPESLLVVVYLIVVTAYPVAAGGASGKMLITARRTRPLAVWAALAAVLNVLLNLLLVPRFGIEGAAAATVVAYATLTLGQRYSMRGHGTWPRTPPRLLLECLVVIILAGVTSVLPQDAVWNWTRFALAVLCLPWMWVQLKKARAEG